MCDEWSQMCSLELSLTTTPFQNLTVDFLAFIVGVFCTCSSWPVNLSFFLIRNGVHLCALDTIVEGQLTIH